MKPENTKHRIGTMPCEGSRCKSHDQKIPVVVFENSKGTLSYRCDYCDRAPYARAGTDQHADWMQDIKFFPEPPMHQKGFDVVQEPVAPAAKATPAAPAAPPAKQSSTLFG